MMILILTVNEFTDLLIEHKSMITLISAIVATIFALVFLLPIWKYKPVTVSRWGNAFGWGFFALAARYSVLFGQWLIGAAHLVNGQPEISNFSLLVSFMSAVLSGISNIFFLKVGIHLLGENRIRRSQHFWRFSVSATALRNIIIGIILSVASLAWFSDYWLARLPDALISAFCIFLAGYAICINISVRRDYVVARAALVIATLYAAVQLFYGFNPLLAQFSDPAVSFRNRLDALDGLAFALALPLKFGTFFPAYFLFMLNISSVRDIHHLLEQIADGRRDLLEHGGLVKTIAESIKADRVSLSIRLPGESRGRIASFVYPYQPTGADPHETQDTERKPIITPLDKVQSTEVKNVFTTGQPVEGTQSVVLPIIFHGAVIGCLEATLRRNRFSETDISELEDLAVFVSSAVYAYRELASIDQISYRIARLQFEKEQLPAKKALKEVVEILHDTLSTSELELYWEMGFNADEAKKCREDGEAHAEESGEPTEEEEKSASERSGLLPIKNELLITLRKDIESEDHTANPIFYVPAGELTFYIPVKKDILLQPTLVTNYLHRRTISNVVADGLLDLARDYLNSVLTDFGVAINQQKPANFDTLCPRISEAAGRAGLNWTVIISADTHKIRYSSSPEASKIANSLNGDTDFSEMRKPLKCAVLNPPVSDTHHVIKLPLDDTGQEMLFGVKRPDFGVELNFASPWYVFLKQFAEIADAALLRITAPMEMRRLQVEALRQEALARSAINVNVLAHDLKNLSGGVLSTLSRVVELVGANRIQIDPDEARLLRLGLASAKKMSEITKVINKEAKLDDHKPCSLASAVHVIETLRTEGYAQEDIALQVELDGNPKIEIPYYIAILALDNMVTNARNAINKSRDQSASQSGRILISGRHEGGSVTCYVSDNGPGVPPENRESIWEYGFSSDPESGGWGLPMIRDLLHENGSSIELLDDVEEGATFRVKFPAVNR
jgi:signal transduction histidine kinase